MSHIAGSHRKAEGAAILRQGFRPFFLAASLWAIAALPLWILMLWGELYLPTAFDPLAWHAHEMIFGFAAAAIAGFLLTAIPNWTGRLPLSGLPLLGVALLWLAGRFAILVSATIGPVSAAVVDLSFFVVLLAFILREIIAGRNWRNLPVVAALVALIVANVVSHASATGFLPPEMAGPRLGIGIIVLLISLIGGRIIPSFTRNWLVKQGQKVLPAPFAGYDRICIILVLLAVLIWVIWPDAQIGGAAFVIAGVATLVRLLRWMGHRTLAEPLLWSLHLGFAWLPVGLLLLGAGAYAPESLPPSGGLHALTAGAAGSMILAVMTRATLGHTGRELSADRWTTAIFGMIFAAAFMRVAAALLLEGYLPLLLASAALWVGAFGLFAVRYGPMLFGASKS
jgi:uncharacterized protein involved in response to NO